MTDGKPIAFRCVCIECEPGRSSPADALVQRNNESDARAAGIKRIKTTLTFALRMLTRLLALRTSRRGSDEDDAYGAD